MPRVLLATRKKVVFTCKNALKRLFSLKILKTQDIVVMKKILNKILIKTVDKGI